MKTLLTTLILFVALSGERKFEMIEGRLAIQQIFEYTGKSTPDLYKKAKAWINKSFENPSKVIVYDTEDPASLKIKYIEKYRVAGSLQSYNNVLYIDIKDGKAKIRFTEITHVDGYKLESYVLKKDGSYSSMYSKLADQVETHGLSMIKSFDDHMKKSEEW